MLRRADYDGVLTYRDLGQGREQEWKLCPNCRHWASIAPAERGKGGKKASADIDDRSFAERYASMTWAQRLKRVFNIGMEPCEHCRGPVRTIACVEDPAAIREILDHLKSKEATDHQARPPPGKAPPQLVLFE